MTTGKWTALAGALAALALLSQPAAATLPGENGRLVVVSGAHPGRIFTLEPDGSDVNEVVPDDGVEDQGRRDAAWSPDGSRLAFGRTVDGNQDVYVMDADGGNVVRLTNHKAGESQPTWSPSGKRLAFTSDRSGNDQVHLITVKGRHLRRVTKGFAGASTPDWGPRGRRIAFAGERHSVSGIYTTRPDGSRPKRLSADSGGEPSWAPGGRRVAYRSTRKRIAWGAERIFTVRHSGTHRRVVPVPKECDDECYLSSSAWSPDGKKIAYVMTIEIDLTSYLIAADLRAGTFQELFDESTSHGLFSVSWQAR